MNKPIQAGCKAITINTVLTCNRGRIVTVIRKLEGYPDNTPSEYGARWETDSNFACIGGHFINHLGERQLQRINEEDRNTKISWADMAGLWQPKDIKQTN